MNKKKKKSIIIIITILVLIALWITSIVLGIHYLSSKNSSYKVADKVEENPNIEEKEEENPDPKEETSKIEELSNEICDISGNVMDCIKEDSEGNKYLNIDFKDLDAFYKLDETQCETLAVTGFGLCDLNVMIYIKNLILENEEVNATMWIHHGFNLTIEETTIPISTSLNYFVLDNKYFVVQSDNIGGAGAWWENSLMFLDNQGNIEYEIKFIEEYTLTSENKIEYKTQLTEDLYETLLDTDLCKDITYPIEVSGTLIYENGTFTKENVEYLDVEQQQCQTEETS